LRGLSFREFLVKIIQMESNPTDLPPPVPPQRIKAVFRRIKAALPFGGGVLAALAALLIYRLAFPRQAPMTPEQFEESVAQVMASATAPPPYASQVYDVVKYSLVLIETSYEEADEDHDQAIGSGVVIDFSGDILTSLHVVDGADEIWTTFADGTRSSAQVIFEQPENDIAVIQALDPPELIPPAILGNPNALEVGDEAFVVGSPFGLYSSLSAGVISGFDRTFRVPGSDQRLEGLIQIDVAVNPGNSGGPLLNRSGHVVGIVTGIVNPIEQSFFVGIGFAVPIDVAAGGFGSPPH
jgi:S1-C subfamily serine protease